MNETTKKRKAPPTRIPKADPSLIVDALRLKASLGEIAVMDEGVPLLNTLWSMRAWLVPALKKHGAGIHIYRAVKNCCEVRVSYPFFMRKLSEFKKLAGITNKHDTYARGQQTSKPTGNLAAYTAKTPTRTVSSAVLSATLGAPSAAELQRQKMREQGI